MVAIGLQRLERNLNEWWVDVNIGIIGTVGVPARYGGFETLAEQLARGIDNDRHALVIYCQRSAYPELSTATPFNGHRRMFLPGRANGAASMVHDALGLLHAALIAKVDAVLILGYSGAWFLPMVRLLRPRMRIVTNIDGMEWRRDKFGRGARFILRMLERFATRFSDRIIADNSALIDLVDQLYGLEAIMIAYGGDHTLVAPGPIEARAPGYGLSIARVEPENNSHLILSAFARANLPLVSIGNWSKSDYGRQVKAQFEAVPHITLLDPIYDLPSLAAVRQGAGFYVHGHSVGGTNPSLVEALFHHDRVLAFDCPFNRKTLDDAGSYFTDEDALCALLQDHDAGRITADDLTKLRSRYQWCEIIDRYVDTIVS